MQESVIIRNFGPIKDIEIQNISPFTVFIGESGSGKSTIMKVIVLFRWIYKMLNVRSYLKYANISQSPFNFDFGQYLKNNGFSDYVKSDTDIIYKKGETTIHYKNKLATSPIVPKEELSLEKMSFITDKRNIIPDILAGNKVDMSFFLNETFNDLKKGEEFIKELNIDYLGVKYISEKTNTGTKYYISDNNSEYKINLEDASSGTQTLVPLSLIVEYFSKYYDFSRRFNNIVFDYLSRKGHPCFRLTIPTIRARSGLAPYSCRPCRANKKRGVFSYKNTPYNKNLKSSFTWCKVRISPPISQEKGVQKNYAFL